MVPSFSQVTWVIILRLLCAALAYHFGAKVRCDPKTQVTAGQSVTLQCQISCEDVYVAWFVWKNKDSDIVVAFKNGKITHKERFMFNQQPFNSSTRDVSLHIDGVTEEDEGKYIYRIASDCVMEEGFTHLIVDDPTTQSPADGKFDQMLPTTEKPQQLSVAPLVVGVVLFALLLLICVIIMIIMKKHRRHHRHAEHTNQREEELHFTDSTTITSTSGV